MNQEIEVCNKPFVKLLVRAKNPLTETDRSKDRVVHRGPVIQKFFVFDNKKEVISLYGYRYFLKFHPSENL